MIVNEKHYIYKVRSGDTLYSIARRYGSSVEAVERANHLYDPVTDPGLIFPGDVLVVPSPSIPGESVYVVNRGDTISSISTRFSTFVDLVAGVNQLQNPNVIFPDQQLIVPTFIYRIQSGDTLFAISRRFAIPLSSITRANLGRPGYQEDVIWPEYHLLLPLPTSRNIVVCSPYPGIRFSSGQRLEGQARAFEANVLHQLRDDNGIIVSNERFTTADAAGPIYGNFSTTVPFDRQPTSSTGELWVYTRSANDGSIQDLVRVRVYF
ncbi:LysM peptidoglycan-binding domain-containing protein [Alteribacillus sp. HJP-4]|uniref:LysM peptidoglycan-binding domain-containing protein n=1 Tax=Alteribacillus sp. HJP-4 TaxID=2775394 RepID=UPI0035CCF4A5